MNRRHPASTALRDVLRDQPDLTVLCTHHPASVIETFGANRMVQLPITENAMIGMATGMALVGQRTLVNVGRMAFLYTALDPLVNQASKWRYMTNGQFNVPLAIRGLTRGGENLGAQHEHVSHSLLSQIPGVVVAVPSSPNSAAGLLRSALVHPDPVVLLESPRLYAPDWEGLPEPEPTSAPIPFGLAHRVTEGHDVTLVAIGNTVRTILAAAKVLSAHGRSVQIIDLRTAAPLDLDQLAELVSLTRSCVLVDEESGIGSLMHSVAYHLMSSGVIEPDRIRVLSGAPCPMPVSPELQAGLIPSVSTVVSAALGVMVAPEQTIAFRG